MENKLRGYFLQNREKCICLGVVLLSILLFLTLGLYLLFGARENFSEVERLKTRLMGIRRFQQQVDFVQQQGIMINKLQCLEERLPEELDRNDLLLHINAQAALGNIKVENLGAQPEEQGGAGKIKALRISIACQGQCQSLLDFMKQLEQGEHLMRFSEVTMESRENDQVALVATLNYFLRQ